MLVGVLDTLLRLLQPFTPFITEELWQRLNEIAPERANYRYDFVANAINQSVEKALLSSAKELLADPGEVNIRLDLLNLKGSVQKDGVEISEESWEAVIKNASTEESHNEMVRILSSETNREPVLRPQPAAQACIIAPWPTGGIPETALERRFARLQETITAVRNVRGVYNISPQATVDVVIKCGGEIASDLESVKEQFESLAKAKIAAIGPEVARPPASASFSLAEADGYVPLAGLIDLSAEKARQEKEAEKLRGFIAGSEKKLSNHSFTDRAPPEVVQEVRDTLASLQKQLASVKEILRELDAAGS